MDFNDCDYHVHQSRAFATTRSFELFFKVLDVQGVTFLKPTLKPGDCFRVTQDLFGSVEIHPAKPKPAFGRSKTTSQNVIESVEIVSPFKSGNYAPLLVGS